jgi:hypothetical protein
MNPFRRSITPEQELAKVKRDLDFSRIDDQISVMQAEQTSMQKRAGQLPLMDLGKHYSENPELYAQQHQAGASHLGRQALRGVDLR